MNREYGPDFFGTPEYFVSRIVKCESAGGNNIRIYCAAERGDELVPLYTAIMPIESLVEGLAFIRKRADDIWNKSQLMHELELN